MAARKDKLDINYLTFEGFKAALVRLTVVSGEMLGGLKEE